MALDRGTGNGILDGVRDPVCRLVDVPEVMGLIDDNEVPIDPPYVSVPARGEVIGADDDLSLVEGVQVPLLYLLVEGLRLQDQGGQEELLQQLLVPLFPEGGWDYDKELPLALRPSLGKDDASLDGLLPRPTSSARMAPFDRGDRKAKRAASIW